MGLVIFNKNFFDANDERISTHVKYLLLFSMHRSVPRNIIANFQKSRQHLQCQAKLSNAMCSLFACVTDEKKCELFEEKLNALVDSLRFSQSNTY